MSTFYLCVDSEGNIQTENEFKNIKVMISAFIRYEDGRVTVHDSATKEVGKVFSKGFYRATTKDGNLFINEESLAEIHAPYSSEENILILRTVEAFFRPEVMIKINKLGFIHKLGILMYGCQGTGKTSLMHYIANTLLDQTNAIIFFCDNENSLGSAIRLAKAIREVQENPIIFIADEFERFAKDAESEMKNFLDGNNSINNTLFLASTNYIEKVPDTLKNRPSRFKMCKEIKGITDKSVMRQIISDISLKIDPNLFTEVEIDEAIRDIYSITLDELKHICLNKAVDSYIRDKKLITKNTVGFKIGQDKEDNKEVQLGGVLVEKTAWVTYDKPTYKDVNPESSI